MILSDREVSLANARGAIGVTDLPSLENRRWSAHTIDLTLDAEIRVWEQLEDIGGVEPPIFSPGQSGFKADPVILQYTQPDTCEGEGFVIRPGQLVLGWTAEKIRLPHESRIGARVEGKSSLARLGVGVHITAPTIHPGFGVPEGKLNYPGNAIRLEIWNFGVYRIRLTKGMAICQLLFEEIHGIPVTVYAGQFAAQGPGAPPPPPPAKPGRGRKK